MVDKSVLAEKIGELKRKKNAVILAHFYTLPEVQDVADFIGDSLALSQEAAKTDADVILFAGVYFMAETAKVLSPEKKVLIPDPAAGCSLADSCNAPDFATFREKYPDHKVVSYVNTSVDIKALTDVCCTSSNAVKVIDSFPRDQKLIFAPDRNLGDYIKRVTGRDDIVLWDGACHVHEKFALDKILYLKQTHPDAKIIAHPECRKHVLMAADFVGSTAALLEYAGFDDGSEYIVATESGILYEMRKRYPGKTFIPAPPSSIESDCACSECEYMKLVTIPKIYDCLLNETPEVLIEEQIRRKAERSIRAMLELSV